MIKGTFDNISDCVFCVTCREFSTLESQVTSGYTDLLTLTCRCSTVYTVSKGLLYFRRHDNCCINATLDVGWFLLLITGISILRGYELEYTQEFPMHFYIILLCWEHDYNLHCKDVWHQIQMSGTKMSATVVVHLCYMQVFNGRTSGRI